jgi:laccase
MYFASAGSGGINHPFHMHGFSFNVIAMGNFENGQDEDDITEDLRRGTLKLSTSPAFKDTLAVPALGYAVIRILANNPGKT